MLVRGIVRAIDSLFAAVFAPSRFVQIQRSGLTTSWTGTFPRFMRVFLVWLVNLVMYAVPLTLSGIGLTTQESAPAWFVEMLGPIVTSSDRLWQLLVGTISNSVFLIVATGLVFVTFHASVAIADWSRREQYFQSLSTVGYTTSVYLVGMFTIVMYISRNESVQVAEEFLLGIQTWFIEGTLGLLGLAVPSWVAGLGTLSLDGLTYQGELLLAVLFVLSIYFLYSMYLGARLNHGLNRQQSGLVVIGVLASPFIYFAGSGVITIILETYGVELVLTAVDTTIW